MDVLVTRDGPEAVECVAVCHRATLAQLGEDFVRTIERLGQRRVVVVCGDRHAAILGRNDKPGVILSRSDAITSADACRGKERRAARAAAQRRYGARCKVRRAFYPRQRPPPHAVASWTSRRSA